MLVVERFPRPPVAGALLRGCVEGVASGGPACHGTPFYHGTPQRTLFTPQWVVYSPEGVWENVANGETYAATIARLGGPEALRQWRELDAAMKPLQVRQWGGAGWCRRKRLDGVGMVEIRRVELDDAIRLQVALVWGQGTGWCGRERFDRVVMVEVLRLKLDDALKPLQVGVGAAGCRELGVEHDGGRVLGVGGCS